MEKRSSRKKKNSPNKKLTRTMRLKKRKRKFIGIIILICVIITLILGGVLLKQTYISSKCSNLTYAVDHYFTKWKDKNLRLDRVQTMALLEKSDNTVKVEAFGLAYNEPHARTTLVGTFKKSTSGSWKMESVEVKAPAS